MPLIDTASSLPPSTGSTNRSHQHARVNDGPPDPDNSTIKLASVVSETFLRSTMCVVWNRAWPSRSQLTRARAVACRNKPGTVHPRSQLNLGDSTWTVLKGRSTSPRWVLRSGGVTLTFIHKPNYYKPNLTIRIDEASCVRHGAFSRYLWVKDLIEAHGTIAWELVDRIDIAMDLAGISIDELADAFRARAYVTDSSRQRETRGGNREISFADRHINLTISETLAGIGAGLPPVKLEKMVRNRWGGTLPSRAIRVLYCLNSELFRALKITETTNYFGRRSEVINHLMAWTRFTDRNLDQVSTPTWKSIDAELRSWAGTI